MSTFTTNFSLTKPDDTDFADNEPLNDNFDIIDKGLNFVGFMLPSIYTSDPSAEWLICDGRAISRTTYSELNSILSAQGYPFGSGDGSTTFNIPNMQNQFPRGKSLGTNIGDSGGAASVNLTEANMPAHTHTTPAHAHSIFFEQQTTRSGNTGALASVTNIENASAAGGGSNYNASTATSGGNDGSGTTGTGSGSGTAVDILPPYIDFNYVIKVL